MDIIDSKIQEYYPDTNLKRIRSNYGISQSELAKRSNVGLRSIQMYEQKNKDINKASADTLYKISKVLGCSIEDLLEKWMYLIFRYLLFHKLIQKLSIEKASF